jgi:hypothetical protein
MKRHDLRLTDEVARAIKTQLTTTSPERELFSGFYFLLQL